MKTIHNLDQIIRDFRGNEVRAQVMPGAQPIPLTIKDALLNLIGCADTPGKDRLIIYTIGRNMLTADGHMELENHEFELVKQAVAANSTTARYTNIIMIPVEDAIVAAQKAAGEPAEL